MKMTQDAIMNNSDMTNAVVTTQAPQINNENKKSSRYQRNDKTARYLEIYNEYKAEPVK